MGFEGVTEGSFSARRRHIEALEQARGYLAAGQQQLQVYRAGNCWQRIYAKPKKRLMKLPAHFPATIY